MNKKKHFIEFQTKDKLRVLIKRQTALITVLKT